MRKNMLCLLLSCLLLPAAGLWQAARAQSRVADYTFGGSGAEIGAGGVPTGDGGFLLFGTTPSNVSGEVAVPPRAPGGGVANLDYWIVKMDAQGNKLWDRRYGGDGDDRLLAVLPAAHGGFLLCGWTNSSQGYDVTAPPKGTLNYWVVRVDALGRKRWDKRYGSATSEMLSNAIGTPDGGFVLTGTTGGPLLGPSGDRSGAIKGASDIWTIKLDSLGNKQWDKTLGSLEGDYVYGVANTPGGGVALLGLPFGGPGGDVSGPAHGGNDMWLVKLDAAGHKVADYLFGGSGNDDANALLATADGGLLLAGYTTSPAGGNLSQGGPAPWLLKLTATGAIEWEKTYPSLTATVGRVLCLAEYPGGGYVLGSYTTTPFTNGPGPDYDMELARVSATGSLRWARSMGGPGAESVSTVLVLPGNELLAIGGSSSGIGRDKTSPSRGQSDYWALKLAETSLSTLPQLPGATLEAYPNPGCEQVTVRASGLLEAAPAGLELLNVLGQVVNRSQAVVRQGSLQYQLATGELPAGFYTLRLKVGDGVLTKQLLKQ